MAKNTNKFLIGALIVIAIIWLPSGIDDIFTTIPIIKAIGIGWWLLIGAIILILIKKNGVKLK